MRPESLLPPRRSWWRRVIVVAVIVATALAATVIVAGRRGSSAPAHVTAPVTVGDLVVKVNAPGALEVLDPVPVPAPFAAVVNVVAVDEDAQVAAGDLLATLDARGLDADAARAGADARQASVRAADASAAVTDAAAALDRARRLQAAGLASAEELEKRTADLEHARAAANAARAARDGIRTAARAAAARAGLAEVRAPSAGIVLRRNAMAGVAVGPDGPPLFVIAPRLDVLRLIAQVDEADVGAIGADATVTFTVPAYPGRVFPARLVRIRSAPSEGVAGVTYDALLDAQDPDRVLRPGMSASVTFVVARRTGVVVVPEAALRWTPDGTPGGRSRVYLLEEDRLRAVTVQPGLSDGARTEVSGDLRPGDQVVIGTRRQRSNGLVGGGTP